MSNETLVDFYIMRVTNRDVLFVETYIFTCIGIYIMFSLLLGCISRVSKCKESIPPETARSSFNRLYAIYEHLVFGIILLLGIYVLAWYFNCEWAIGLWSLVGFLVFLTKYLAETFIVSMSLISISVYFTHLEEDLKTNWTWSEKFSNKFLGVVMAFMCLKETSMILCGIFVLKFQIGGAEQLFLCYFGLHLSTQFLYWISIIISFVSWKNWRKMVHSEQMITRQTITLAYFKLYPTLTIIYKVCCGFDFKLCVIIFMMMDILFLSLTVRFVETKECVKMMNQRKLKEAELKKVAA
ncbi:hypothetical protein CRE_15973 [Caenorhabditis remanei]|uniref:Uncharacterized protein n=1 Tax=Caenorhabditis remanei TaxID=31234 RepID=E3MBU6_CAERE|nr:hypothetical protein CRE_15973 [Caenorhabditis remanei]